MLALAVAVTGCGAGGKAIMRVNCGDTKEYTDLTGATWSADQALAAGAKFGATGGLTVVRPAIKDLEATQMARVYLTEHYSMTHYTFALPKGTYTVRLHFCETYEGIKAAGQRVFTVKVQGNEVLKDLDVFKEAGGWGKPLVNELRNVEVTDGKLVIEFVPKTQNAEINGIEILQ
jgi:hypothetical protein